MNLKTFCATAFAFVATTMIYAAPASAQATRTWVSGVGDDVNPCSRTAPCKTFAGSISKTAAGGEINCLDSGGFGAVTITKSITIDCTATQGGVLVATTNGINVSIAGINVVLRNLTINGLIFSPTTPGQVGIRLSHGASLTLDNVVIENFVTGISLSSNEASELYVSNSLILGNGQASPAQGGGVEIAPAAGGSARVVIRGTRILNSGNFGVQVSTAGTTAPAGIIVALDDVEISGGAQGVIALTPTSTTTASLMISKSRIASNAGFGILTSGAGATARVGSSVINGNVTGVLAAGGSSIRSYGTNQLNGNATDGTFTSPNLPLQ